jgi:hypothetical protein
MGGLIRKALALAILVCFASVPSVLAAGRTRAKSHHGSSGSITYSVYFSGSGSFTSTDTEATEGVEQCSGATDTVVEHTTFYWDTGYTVTVPRSGELLGHSVKGSHFRTKSHSTWTQDSTVTPAGCLGGNRTAAPAWMPPPRAARPMQAMLAGPN